MGEFLIISFLFIAGLFIVGLYSKWIGYNIAKGFYQGKKAFFNNLQEKKHEEKDEKR